VAEACRARAWGRLPPHRLLLLLLPLLLLPLPLIDSPLPARRLMQGTIVSKLPGIEKK
jgi:hypothetical protein